MTTSIGTVFVAAPFWAYVDKETGAFDAEAFEAINRVLEHYDAKGCVVHNAHRREKWGRAFMEPEEFTVLDYQQICSSDLVVAVPGSPASPGTHIEIGWASANRVPTVLLLEADKEYAGLITGLGAFAPVRILQYTDRVDLDLLDAAVEEVLAKAADRRRSTVG
ncbi:nucleoside 2-deoxyribosyltransferase [Streptomyces sp. 4N509B]|uniref:nucleoside 2-deoxyribosyltransferase n=1 Tax=Streptomyces sp. 4N509B TaxID=3457413 RepID=UPI003FD5C876